MLENISFIFNLLLSLRFGPPPTLLPRSLADLETTTLRRWRRGHRDLDDAFAERCPRLFRDRADRKRDDTKEAAVAALAVIEALAFLFALPAAFAVNRHGIVANVDRHLVFFQAREIHVDAQLVVLLRQLDLWGP